MNTIIQKLKEVDIKRIFKVLYFVLVGVTLIGFWIALGFLYSESVSPDEFLPYSVSSNQESTKENCNVAGIKLHGQLVTYAFSDVPNGADSEDYIDVVSSEGVVSGIEAADADPSIYAIFLEVDSPGGSGVAGEEVANALRHASKPTVAMIRDNGTSAAYMAATGAKMIFASKFSDVGSIGVTSSFTDESMKNQKDGITYNQLSSGKFKDMGDPDKLLTTEEKDLILRDLKIKHENFVALVAENRKLNIEKVRILADGSSVPAEMGLQNGLIDKIGGINEVREHLRTIIEREPKFCW
ncbi:MAG: S49 family peptidase [Candidatus Paceibacterota bacterium]|jgi:protease-4